MRILILVLLMGLFASCNDLPNKFIGKFSKGENVRFAKNCPDRYADHLIFKGANGIVLYFYESQRRNSEFIKVFMTQSSNTYVVSGECLEKIDSKSEPTPQPHPQTKFDIILEYHKFLDLCKKYSEIFKVDSKPKVEGDKLTCSGKDEKAMEMELEVVERFKKANSK